MMVLELSDVVPSTAEVEPDEQFGKDISGMGTEDSIFLRFRLPHFDEVLE